MSERNFMSRNTVVIFFLLLTVTYAQSVAAQRPSNNPNDYSGSDSERIAAALDAAKYWNGVIRIASRAPDAESDRQYWLLDSAILLPSNTTLILDNCQIKLSDSCRDNFVRSANCGIGVKVVSPVENVSIVGIGVVTLVGADRPRATGDSGKTLGVRAYGTDAGKEGESQTGDWRNIGILLANVHNFRIENIQIKNAHAWSLSLERCENGLVRNLTFDSEETRVIDGQEIKALNVDGLDLRKGCRNIVVDGIYGHTGDDLVAVTAIGPGAREGGALDSTEVSDFSADENYDVYNITIRNVVGYAAGGHQIVRLLNASGIKIYRVMIDGVMDTSPEEIVDRATIRIGDANPAWGGVTPLGDTYGVTISNVHSQSRHAILVAGSLVDSTISNVVNYHSDAEILHCESGKENVRNVTVNGTVDVGRERR